LTKQALYRLEQGNNEPTWQTVQLLAAALGVDYADFADPGLQLPEEVTPRPRGRPLKVDSGRSHRPGDGVADA
jgi:transcriptional regulator with XRE-family HTH domain